MRQSSGLLPGLILCIALSVLGEFMRNMLAFPLPGGVIGFFLLLLLFASLPPLQRHVERGAELLLDNLLLLFIPAVMSIIAHPEFFGMLGLKILIILVTGTALMMVSVGLFAQTMLRRAESADEAERL